MTQTTRRSAARYRIARGVVAREVSTETVLLNLESGLYFSLNEAGSVIWSRISEGRPAEDAAAALCEAYEVTRGVAAHDVAAFLDELLRLGLLETP